MTLSLTRRQFLAALAALSACDVKTTEQRSNVYNAIRNEAAALDSETNHPLPLVSSWNASTWWNQGTSEAGFSPSWQLDLIEQGHSLFPWFEIPTPEMTPESTGWDYYWGYFEAPFKRAAHLNLPISFIGTQWEQRLIDDPAYFNLPYESNPNVMTPEGVVLKKLSPFGPTAPWYEVGKTWGSSPLLQRLVALYPSPPRILFASNNEAAKLNWGEAETDRRYLDLYGLGRADDFKRKVIGDGWIRLYNALIQGFRDGLTSDDWKDCSKFVGYRAFGPGYVGQWGGWKEYSLYIPNRIDPNPLTWEGGSSSLYIYADRGVRDNNVNGLLFQSMDWVFILNEARQLNPSFWYEFSCWDGSEASHQAYRQLGQSMTPERYKGFVQYAMWTVRPRIVRQYQDWDLPRESILPWMNSVISAVDLVYKDAKLQPFWRNSDLVMNPIRPHPYQSDMPPEYSGLPRMFLLTSDREPALPWTGDTEFPVMSLLRSRGTSPRRTWLLYSYAPLGRQSLVRITIPDFSAVTVSVLEGGSFYLIDEASGEITPVGL
jgi:hypothetical protein